MNAVFSSSGKTIAIFDFDHTLIEGDSFWKFLSLTAGWPRTVMATVEGLFLFALHRHKKTDNPEHGELRTFLKAHLLRRLLAGRPVSQFSEATGKLFRRTKWKDAVRNSLLEHHAAGHIIVIASGGLDLYLPDLLADIPHHALICTKVGLDNGIVTGEMISGNCVRRRKAELVSLYLAQRGPFEESWGYGNLPHDLPMLNLLKYRVVV